jgi:AcrR family transcriptional regulator
MPAKTTPAPPPPPKTKQVRKKPAVRAEEILVTACAAFIADGYAAFSLRQVAAAAGVRLGTLQYYYPTREALLSATIERALKTWRQGFTAVADQTDVPAAERIRRLLHLNLDYIVNTDAASLLFEVFALAQHEPFARTLLQAYYLEYRLMFVRLFREISPELPDDRAMALATLLTSQMEGLMVFTVPDDPAMLPQTPLRSGLDRFAAAVVEMLSA